VFSGRVKAKQQDGTLECQKLEVHFAKEGGGLDKLVADGEVKISQGENTGTCQKAVYEFLPQEKVTMSGQPLLTRGQQKFSGETIVFYLKEQKVVIKNNVLGVVFPQKKGQGPKPLF